MIHAFHSDVLFVKLAYLTSLSHVLLQGPMLCDGNQYMTSCLHLVSCCRKEIQNSFSQLLFSLESTTTVKHKAQEASKVLQQKHSCGTKLLLENCKFEKRQMNYARHLRLQRAKLGQHQRLQISCTKDPFSGGLYVCKRGCTYQKANSDCTLPLRALEAFTKYVKQSQFLYNQILSWMSVHSIRLPATPTCVL